ncbi:hypothetical protein L345_13784, partial [Ophiophagus hannah]
MSRKELLLGRPMGEKSSDLGDSDICRVWTSIERTAAKSAGVNDCCGLKDQENLLSQLKPPVDSCLSLALS